MCDLCSFTLSAYGQCLTIQQYHKISYFPNDSTLMPSILPTWNECFKKEKVEKAVYNEIDVVDCAIISIAEKVNFYDIL